MIAPCFRLSRSKMSTDATIKGEVVKIIVEEEVHE